MMVGVEASVGAATRSSVIEEVMAGQSDSATSKLLLFRLVTIIIVEIYDRINDGLVICLIKSTCGHISLPFVCAVEQFVRIMWLMPRSIVSLNSRMTLLVSNVIWFLFQIAGAFNTTVAKGAFRLHLMACDGHHEYQ